MISTTFWLLFLAFLFVSRSGRSSVDAIALQDIQVINPRLVELVGVDATTTNYLRMPYEFRPSDSS
jgi:hypothetical protein